MHKLSMRVIYLARKYLFHTKLGKTRLAAWLYAFLFELSAPDLTRPILFRSISLYVDPTDRAIVPSIVGGYYEEKELDIFEELVKHAGVLFDIGANIGMYSVIGCLKSAGLVSYAFEPVTENQRLLERNVAAHNLEDRLRLQPFAVSDKSGKARIHLHHSATHSIENDQGGSSREVDTISLDEFTASAPVGPDIIKIDVEGHEAAVLDGALETLARYAPTVFMEYIPAAHRDVDALVERICSLFNACFVIDEISRSVIEIEPRTLGRHKGCNLILTADRQHASEIRTFVTA